jgi:hypothetical protein
VNRNAPTAVNETTIAPGTFFTKAMFGIQTTLLLASNGEVYACGYTNK